MDQFGQLIGFIEETTYEDVPASAIEASKKALQDFLGVALYGSQTTGGEIMTEYVEAVVPGTDATVFANSTASIPGAALANGTFGHVSSYDDTFESIIIHPTSPVFPAALAIAEHADSTGEELLAAYLVGVETVYRVGHSLHPSHYENYWHSTGTLGAFGATAAASSALGLSAAEIQHAMGIVASCSSGVLSNGGTMTKGLHAGHAAQVGVQATLLAQRGFRANDDVFAGTRGYGRIYTPGGEYDPTKLSEGLGEEWAVFDIGYKPSPSARITHAPISAMRQILERESLSPDDVDSVTVVIQEAFTETVKPADELTVDTATSSIPFVIAAVMRRGQVGVREYTSEFIDEERTHELMEKVRTEFVPDLFGGGFGEFGARVKVRTADGQEFVEEERDAYGSPENPMSDERFDGKYFECAEFAVDRAKAEAILETVASLEAHSSLDEFSSTLRA